MPAGGAFPWDLLKAECLRLVCTQLVQGSNEGGSYQGAGRKEDMVDFLRDVDKRGLELALKKLAQTQTPHKPSASPAKATSSPKRKSSRLEETDAEGDSSDLAHNTRFKGTKRVKLTKEDPESSTASQKTPSPRKASKPRKSTDAAADATKRPRGRPRKSDGVNSDAPSASKATKAPKPTPKKKAPAPPAVDETGAPIKRGRGRPRKSVEDALVAPVSKSRSVFDGVLLEKRKTSVAVPVEQPEEPEEPKPTGEGENAVEEDVVLSMFLNHGQNDLSSLGGSNKENEPNDVIPADDHDADADADGEPDPQVMEEIPATT